MNTATAVTATLVLLSSLAQAGILSMSDGQRALELVAVGEAGNQADVGRAGSGYGSTNSTYQTGYGSVGYTYQIGKYDVTSAQYCQFLNAVASVDDPYGLYNPNMATAPVPYTESRGTMLTGNPYSVGCGIIRSGEPGHYSYSVAAGKENMPVNWVSWGDAVRFCNWLSNGQPTGRQVVGITETGSYTLNGDNYEGITRNPGANFVLPSQNEWYKAAYYDPNKPGGAGYWLYPTKSDTMPSNTLSATGTNNANYLVTVDHYLPPSTSHYYTDPQNYLTPVGYFAGSPGPYGTFDMGGNVFQWMDTYPYDSSNALAIFGGYYGNTGAAMCSAYFPGPVTPAEYECNGFRVAVIPEPSCIAILSISVIALARRRVTLS